MTEFKESILSVRNFGIAYGEQIVVAEISFEVPERGVFVLMGPAGTGKSTLIRTLAGVNSSHPALRTWGEVYYAGAKLDDLTTPAIVAQNAKLLIANVYENIVYGLPERDSLQVSQKRDIAKRLLTNAGLEQLIEKMDESVVKLPLGLQRHLAILRTVASNPKMILIDEPTTGLDEKYSTSILDYIKEEAQRRAVLIVLHNQKQARSLGGVTALLAGGYIQELKATREFFQSPQNQTAKDFVRSGSCCVPSPGIKPDHLDSEYTAPPPLPEAARKFVSDAFGPRNFLWLEKGILAGTPRPGLVADMDYDLKALQRVGITVLVSLTTKPVDPALLAQYGIQGIHFPIKDMGVPTPEAAVKMCNEINTLISQGQAIALHCKAGLGRTGTMLAAQLIWKGASALEALESVRQIEPRWVQSDQQVSFLESFVQAVATNSVPQKQITPIQNVQ